MDQIPDQFEISDKKNNEISSPRSHSLNSSQEVKDNEENKHRVFLDRCKKKVYDSKQRRINEDEA